MDFLNAITPQYVVWGCIASVVAYTVVCFVKRGSEDLGVVKSTPTEPQTDAVVFASEVQETPTPKESVLKRMTKSQLEEHARELGVELDRRMTKVNMIADLKGQLSDRGRN